MARAVLRHTSNNLIDWNLIPFRLPARVRRITPHAPEIAPAGAYEDRGHPHQLPLALDRIEDFGNLHALILRARFGMGETPMLRLSGRRHDVRYQVHVVLVIVVD